MLIEHPRSSAAELCHCRHRPEGVFVPGLSSVPVTHAEQVMEILVRFILNA